MTLSSRIFGRYTFANDDVETALENGQPEAIASVRLAPRIGTLYVYVYTFEILEDSVPDSFYLITLQSLITASQHISHDRLIGAP
jgi:hypothetical protein